MTVTGLYLEQHYDPGFTIILQYHARICPGMELTYYIREKDGVIGKPTSPHAHHVPDLIHACKDMDERAIKVWMDHMATGIQIQRGYRTS